MTMIEKTDVEFISDGVRIRGGFSDPNEVADYPAS